MSDYERHTYVDGYTIVWREKQPPKIHLLRPYDSCEVEGGVKVEGSRELLMLELGTNRIVECRKCFPRPKRLEQATGEIEYADDED